MQIEHFTSQLPLAEYISEYRNVERFIEFCKACNGYGKTWACPPFDEPQPLEEYAYITIVGSKIHTPKQQIDTPEAMREVVRDIFDTARLAIDAKLLAIEALYPTSRALFPGSCRNCPSDECTRIQGKPCIKPEKMRPSLEALGFDISRTTSQLLGIELKWGSATELPDYYTLVYGILSHEPIPLDTLQL